MSVFQNSVLRASVQPTRCDRFVDRAWWISIMTIIVTTSMTALIFVHRALFDLIGMRPLDAAVHLCAAISFGMAAFLLCRHRNDLLN